MENIDVLNNLNNTINLYNRKIMEAEVNITNMTKALDDIWLDLSKSGISNKQDLDTKINELNTEIETLNLTAEQAITTLQAEIARLDDAS